MKVCVIGNSHLAAIKRAWDLAIDDRAGVDGHFFGSSFKDSHRLEPDGGRLVASGGIGHTPPGVDAIAIDAYEAFLLVGLSTGLSNFVSVIAKHRTVSTDGAQAPHLVSDGAFDLAVRRSFESSAGASIASMIRSVSRTAPIVIMPSPLFRRGITTMGSPLWRAAAPWLPRLELAWRKAVDEFAATNELIFDPQPEETVEDRFWTKDAYGLGSIRMSGGMTEERTEVEFRHMNPDYGLIALRSALRRLGVDIRSSQAAPEADVDSDQRSGAGSAQAS